VAIHLFNFAPALAEGTLLMTASDHSHAHDVAAAPAEDLFPEREWLEFREADRQAAKRIVLLMAGIFVVGIVLYSIVVITL
jgi:hypothetical protein